MKHALVDIGTLRVKTLIIETHGKTYQTIYQSNNSTWLGAHMIENNNEPLPENLENTLKELKRLKELFETEQVNDIHIISTHALREMGEVGKGIAKRILAETSFKVEIISQQEEAELFFNGIMQNVGHDQDIALVDVGGGSVQVLIGNRKKLKETHLFKLGSSLLYDLFITGKTPQDHTKPEDMEKMRQHIQSIINDLPKHLNIPLVYGSSCIIDFFKAAHLSLEPSTLLPDHPYQTSLTEMGRFYHDIMLVPFEDREKKYPFRSDYYHWGISQAFLNVITIAKHIDASCIIPSNSNINQGLIHKILKV